MKTGILLLSAALSNASADIQPSSINLENSSLSEFVLLASDLLSRPVVVTADLDKPLSINADFKDSKELISLLRNSVVSSGLSFDDSTKTIVIGNFSIMDNPDLLTDSYLLHHLPSSYAFEVLNGLFQSKLLRSQNKQGKNQNQSNDEQSINNQPLIVDSSSNNSVVVTATAAQHKNIAKIIDSIDFPRRQVLIEAVVSELSDTAFDGLDTRFEFSNELDSISSNLQSFHPALGFSLRLLNSKSLKFFLDYVKTNDQSRVLSKPKLLTLDREQASIIVGQNVPFVTGKSTSQASDTDNPFQTITRSDIGLKLRVTPIITPSGLIELSIYQEISSVNTDTQASDIVTNIRSITSKALLTDGQSVLLGGLVSNTVDYGQSASLPFLSDIPLIGSLFSGYTDSNKQTNLVVMISAKVFKADPALSDEVRPAGPDQLLFLPSDVPVTHQ